MCFRLYSFIISRIHVVDFMSTVNARFLIIIIIYIIKYYGCVAILIYIHIYIYIYLLPLVWFRRMGLCLSQSTALSINFMQLVSVYIRLYVMCWYSWSKFCHRVSCSASDRWLVYLSILSRLQPWSLEYGCSSRLSFAPSTSASTSSPCTSPFS
jgi:hypothetical protein